MAAMKVGTLVEMKAAQMAELRDDEGVETRAETRAEN
jgi:hypothetical protein